MILRKIVGKNPQIINANVISIVWREKLNEPGDFSIKMEKGANVLKIGDMVSFEPSDCLMVVSGIEKSNTISDESVTYVGYGVEKYLQSVPLFHKMLTSETSSKYHDEEMWHVGRQEDVISESSSNTRSVTPQSIVNTMVNRFRNDTLYGRAELEKFNVFKNFDNIKVTASVYGSYDRIVDTLVSGSNTKLYQPDLYYYEYPIGSSVDSVIKYAADLGKCKYGVSIQFVSNKKTELSFSFKPCKFRHDFGGFIGAAGFTEKVNYDGIATDYIFAGSGKVFVSNVMPYQNVAENTPFNRVLSYQSQSTDEYKHSYLRDMIEAEIIDKPLLEYFAAEKIEFDLNSFSRPIVNSVRYSDISDRTKVEIGDAVPVILGSYTKWYQVSEVTRYIDTYGYKEVVSTTRVPYHGEISNSRASFVGYEWNT